jgi:hypothetical protein
MRVKRHKVGLGLDVVVVGATNKADARQKARELIAARLDGYINEPNGVRVRLWNPDDPYSGPLRPMTAVRDFSANVIPPAAGEVVDAG